MDKRYPHLPKAALASGIGSAQIYEPRRGLTISDMEDYDKEHEEDLESDSDEEELEGDGGDEMTK